MIDLHSLEQMRNEIERSTQLKESEWSDFAAIFRPLTLKKNSNVVFPGDPTSGLYFVCSGLLRYYYVADDGKEWNKAFVAENSLAASFSQDFLGYSTPYGIQALENTVLLSARYSDFETLCERHVSIERLGRRFVEQILRVKLMRERSFLEHDATSRYRDFLRQSAALSGRIPQYHLASYLGISEVSLSRLRGQIFELEKDAKST